MSISGTKEQSALRASLAPLYIANLVCSMSMMGFVTLAGPLADTLGLEAWHIGLSATAGGLGWVLTARAWGGAADRIGRKPVLVYGLAGFATAYFALCLVVQAGSAWGLSATATVVGLVATRFTAGLGYSALPAAGGALIADRYTAEDRTGAMGRLGAAQASGLLLGPGLVALIAGPSPVTTLFLLALMPLFALGFLVYALPKDGKTDGSVVPPLPITDARLLRPIAIALCAMVAIGIAQIVVGFSAIDRLDLSGGEAARVAGLALVAVAVALIVAQMIVGKLGWPPRRLILVGGLQSAFGLLCAGFAEASPTLILAYAIGGFGAGWVMPAISAAAANAVEANEQGRAAGSVSTALGIGAMIGPFLGGLAYASSGTAPYLIAAVFMVVAALVGSRLPLMED